MAERKFFRARNIIIIIISIILLAASVAGITIFLKDKGEAEAAEQGLIDKLPVAGNNEENNGTGENNSESGENVVEPVTPGTQGTSSNSTPSGTTGGSSQSGTLTEEEILSGITETVVEQERKVYEDLKLSWTTISIPTIKAGMGIYKPELQIEKTATGLIKAEKPDETIEINSENVPMVRPGDLIIYTIKVSNTGNYKATNVIITEALDVKFDGKEVKAGEPLVKLATLESGKVATLKVAYVVTEEDIAKEKNINNTAYVVDGNVEEQDDDYIIPVNPDTEDITGTKTWVDSDDQDGKRPESITVNLLADGVKIQSKQVKETDSWKWTFSNLPKYSEDGKVIEYTISEEAIEDYTTSINGYDITNTHIPEIVEVSGSKIWEDNYDQDGIRPDSITINLLADGEEVDSKTVTEADGWKWDFTGLPKYEAGREIVYTIEEEEVTGYTTEVSGYNVTNTHTPEIVEVSGSKTWEDNYDQDGIRPDSITINLLADGEEVDSRTITKADRWEWDFTGLPKYEEGREIVYTIEEEKVTGYTTEVSGYNVTNKYTPETITVSGSKTWEDNDDQDGIRPESITITLFADNAFVARKTVTEENNWSWSFTGLPKYEDGEIITYTITEDPVSAYGTEVDGYNVTNKYTPETITISGSKVWNDNGDQAGERPDSITINLLADGTEVDSKEVTADDNWSWSFTGKAKYSEGTAIVYTIEEEPVEDYISEVSGYNVKNTYRTDVTVTKVWEDEEDQGKIRPDSIEIQLYKTLAGETTPVSMGTDYKITLSVGENGKWDTADLTHTWNDLPKYDINGNEITYTVQEVNVPNGYQVIYSADTFTITNILKSATASVTVYKEWVTPHVMTHPDIHIQLYQNGEKYGEKITLSAGTDGVWEQSDLSYTWTNLPKYKINNGQLVIEEGKVQLHKYTVKEVDVDDNVENLIQYITTYSDDIMPLDEQEITPDKTIVNTAKGVVETVTYENGIELYNRPVDVVLVLDISGSMAEANSQGNSKAKDMVAAVNETITMIMKHNPLSKVAVVTYNSNVTTILPLGRYKPLDTNGTDDEYTIGYYLTCSQGSWNSYSGEYSNVSISTNVKYFDDQEFDNQEYSVTGATYIQGGIAQGANILSGADTVYVPDGAAATTRIPVLILLSDGEPTQCTESYDNVGNPTDTDGDSSATLDDAYYTILTANAYSEKIKENYGVVNFYTIGYGADTLLLRTVLNPDEANIDECKVSKNNSKTKKLYDELAKTTAGAYGYDYAKASYTSGKMSATELSSLLNHFIHSSIPSTEYRIFTRDEIEKGKVYLDNIDTTDGFSLTYGDKTYLSLDATKKDGNEWLVKQDTTNNKLYLDLKAVYMDLYGFTSEEQLQKVEVSEQIYVKYHEKKSST